jgi:Flp pilus assembly protein TadG
MRTCARKQWGAVAAEFILVLPILLTIILGTIDWGWYFCVREVAINAAREGARNGSLLDHAADPDGINAATRALSSFPSCAASVAAPTFGGAVRINVTCANTVLTNFFPATLVPRTLTVSAEMRHE